MNIVLSGSQCSGKTTLFNMLRDDEDAKRFGFTFITSASRKLVILSNVKINRESNDESQISILGQQLLDWGTIDKNNNKVYIFDRNCWDTYVYSLWLYRNNKIKYSTLHLISIARERTVPDIELYCEPLGMVEDGIRETDLEYRKQIIDLYSITKNSSVIDLNGDKQTRFVKAKKIIFDKIYGESLYREMA